MNAGGSASRTRIGAYDSPPLVVRSWNLFHGNTVPPRRREALESMVRLATTDGPAIVCLQELPAWSLGRLGEWSGMQVVGDVAERPSLGPLPSTAEIGRILTGLHHGFLRSAFSGQANAVLLAGELRLLSRHALVLNDRDFRRAQSAWLGLGRLARLAWASERRIAQVMRAALPDGRTLTLANAHLTFFRPDERVPDAELLRAAVFTESVAEPDDVCVIAGDFNLRAERSATFRELREWGYSEGGRGIDHVLVRGAAVSPVTTWPRERRLLPDGAALSDHAPVEVTLT